MRILKTSPIFFVEHIESLLSHWRDQLGYEVRVEVPHGEHLGFVILERDGQEIMLQSFESAREDFPSVFKEVKESGVMLYHEVDSVSAFQKKLSATELLLGPRETSYGAREIFILDPAGFVHGYAQRLSKT